MADYFYTLPFLLMSMIGCASIIITSLRFEPLRNGYPFKFVYFLSIIDFFIVLNLALPPALTNSHIICSIQGFVNISFSILDLLWKSYMSFEMYRVKFYKKDPMEYGYKKPLVALAFISCLFGAVPAIFSGFGPSGPWCWITGDEFLLELRLICFYLPTWICIFFNVFVAFKVYNRLKGDLGDEQAEVVRKIRNYPMSLAIIYTPITIFGPYLKKFDTKNEFYVISLCIYALIGVFNVIFYAIDNEVKGYLRKLCQMKKSKTSQTDNSLSLTLNQFRETK